jgi:xyloglucan-specific endo-beta-1,4-glucanase
MKTTFNLVTALLISYARANPVSTLAQRSTTWCGSWGSVQAGPYVVYHNNWGAGSATSGQQCTTFESLDGNSVSWSTSWTWQGGSWNVKSYSNVALEQVYKPLSSVNSIPSTWNWQ